MFCKSKMSREDRQKRKLKMYNFWEDTLEERLAGVKAAKAKLEEQMSREEYWLLILELMTGFLMVEVTIMLPKIFLVIGEGGKKLLLIVLQQMHKQQLMLIKIVMENYLDVPILNHLKR